MVTATQKQDLLTNFTSHNTRTNQGEAEQQAESPYFIKLNEADEQRQRVDSSTPEPESNLLPDVQETSIETIMQPKVSTQQIKQVKLLSKSTC